MHVLAAPDSFKESISAADAARAIVRGAEAAGAGVTAEACPVADGGEGTVDAIVTARAGERRTTEVVGPLGEPVRAAWGLIDDGRTAVIEMAEAAGLHLVPEDRRDPTRTTTFGVGQLIAAALDAGVTRIIVGIGGSATTDGGAGMAQALGVRFTTAANVQPDAPLTGGALAALRSVDVTTRDRRLDGVEVVVACDVTNPLTGPRGAAAVYSPQKGATPGQVATLDRNLAHLASLVHTDADAPGAGAAGGLGFGLTTFCGARITPGIDLVLDAVRFDQRVAHADLVLTGEGRIDGQSVSGKACIGIARAAAKHNVPTVALVGSVGEGAEQVYDHHLCAFFCIADGPMTLDESRRRAAELIERAARNVVRCRAARIEP